ncbi:hypothetical protein [Streptomyces inhibens]|uniref:hypothetical protein n=1 Tax=Streptomyces inhibens TaxID=2293571 RepID=UPI001EE69568|nr:hypothetical protein [Streptomyces inhibens]UKY48507.1 hypothetical protein KI385_06635 [Streptomyces inhibens]
MSQKLNVTTIRNHMSLIRTSMPVGKQPDNSLCLQLLSDYRAKSKRASRKKQAFPITLPYLIPLMVAAEADSRPIGWRDADFLPSDSPSIVPDSPDCPVELARYGGRWCRSTTRPVLRPMG